MIDTPPPLYMARTHVVLRLLIAIVLGTVTNAIGWPGGFLYLVVPVVSAVMISQHRAERFFERDARPLTSVYGWLLSFQAYMMLLTDRLPIDKGDRLVRYEGETHGHPTVGSALARILTSLPLAIVLCFVGIASAILWVLAAISVLVIGRYPTALFDFQCGVLDLQGRALAYHASLVDDYPRITLSHSEHRAAA